MINRSDIKQEKGEGFGLWALEETIRTVCRRTGLCKRYTSVLPLYANTHSVAISYQDAEVLAVNKVIVASLPGNDAHPTTYCGTFNATTGTATPVVGSPFTIITGNAPSHTTYGFYICSTAGTLLVDNIKQAFAVGDLIYSTGSAWQQWLQDAFMTLGCSAKTVFDKYFNQSQVGRNVPGNYATEDGQLFFYPPPKYDTAYSFLISIVPNLLDYSTNPYTAAIIMEDVPLPVIAEDAIIAGAKAMLYEIPASAALENPKMIAQYANRAEAYKKEFERLMGGLRSAALIGESGSAYYYPASFTGRNNRFTPWQSDIGRMR
jgi:hypothetical protein